MSIFSFLTGLWMGFVSILGFHQPPPLQNASTTPDVMQQQQGNTPTQNQSHSSNQTSSNTSQPSITGTSVAAALPTGSPWESTLPLGDGKYTTSGAKIGYIYVCHVASGGGGAQGNPTWIHGSSWSPSEKVAVQGSVKWPSASFSMNVSGSTRTIASNGEPTDNPTGTFPIAQSDPAHQFDANPNHIAAQSYSYSLPAYPTAAASPNCIYGKVGIMIDGIPLFDGFDAEYRDAVAHETQDSWEGHPDQTSEYHFHGFESGFVKEAVSQVAGFAFDGYPITGSALPNGNYLHTVDLDECHGLTSTITLDGKSVTTYHYVLTQDFPYSVSCFHAKSYEPKPGGAGSSSGGQQGGQQSQTQQSSQNGTPPAPPQAAIDACTGKSSGASCTVSGGPSGTCAQIGSYLACKPQ